MNVSFFNRLSAIALGSFSLATSTFALIPPGNDNPTGSCGIFNGNSNTGCSYDPYTGNATRTINDLVVSQSVGAYPLQWSRTMNSRDRGGGGDLGAGGGWRHSYQWSCIADSSNTTVPSSYTVKYPDGRVIVFGSSSPEWQGPLGVNDRFHAANGDNQDCYLISADGGQVHFTQHMTGPDDTGEYFFTFSPPAMIVDPYGMSTTLAYTSGLLTKVTDASGRYLQIDYTGADANQVYHVSAYTPAGFLAQRVTYAYQTQTFGGADYLVLITATYRGDSPGAKASYFYQNSNVTPSGTPLIQACQDLRYPGPMKNISYDFRGGSTYGVLLNEKNADGTKVVTLDITSTNARTETRGDGAVRTFTYGTSGAGFNIPRDYFLATVTDFKAQPTNFGYDNSGHISQKRDAKLRNTYFTSKAATGAITQITHPADHNGVTSTINFGYQDDATGYYLASVQDELTHTTTYTNHPNGSTTTVTINHADGGVENYTYNGFNQVTSHTMVSNTSSPGSGGTETFVYDTSHRLWKYYPPATPVDGDPNPSANPTINTYDDYDHLYKVTDPRNNTTTFGHNERGQLALTINADPHSSKIINDYKDDGTLADTKVDTGDTQQVETIYDYDNYKRLRTVTGPGHPNSVQTNYWYHKAGVPADDYTHTESAVTLLILPSGKETQTAYDDNWRQTKVIAGYGTPDAATTAYNYDEVGNLLTKTEPNYYPGGPHWTYTHDPRDRLLYVDDPTGSDLNTDGHTTSYTYDLANNVTSVLPANNQTVTHQYDFGNRVQQTTIGQWPNPIGTATTNYTWTKAGKLESMIDPNNNTYNYSHDLLNRVYTTTYPDGSTETNTYDKASNRSTYKNRFGNVQTFLYDTRNREYNYSWSGGNVQPRTLVWDDASRMTGCNTTNTHINFTYFKDGLLASQEEWATGSYGDGTHHTLSYTYDDDGNRASVGLPNTVVAGYTYTGRNQVLDVTAGVGGTKWAEYAYDASGNMKTRTLYNGVGNTSSSMVYDTLNRVQSINYTFNGSAGWCNYGYDVMSNVSYVQRGDGTADGMTYDKNNQIINFVRDGTLNGSTVTGGTSTSLTFDASGNWASVNGDSAHYGVNNLNQYTKFAGKTPAYGTNGVMTSFNSWSYAYDAMKRLISANTSGTTSSLYYDGLNRQVARTINGTTVYSVWDGWNLYAEFSPGNPNTPSERLVYGAGSDLLESPLNHQYYYPNAFGSTAYLCDGQGNLLERYKYDMNGVVTVYGPNNNVLPGESVSHLYNGQQWYPELQLYDLRNRFYKPDMGRFLQPDPTGFSGDAANLYRYCGNNPVTRFDPNGTFAVYHQDGDYYSYRVPGDFTQLIDLMGSHVTNGEGGRLQCAGTAQVYGGGYDGNGVFHDVPLTRLDHGQTPNWFEGETLNYTMAPGTLVAKGWAEDGSYPNDPGGSNHTLWLIGYDAQGNAYLESAWQTSDVNLTILTPEEQWEYNEADVPSARGPYDPAKSTAISIAGKTDTGELIYEGRVVTSPNEDFFGNGTFETQNASGLEGSGRNDWLKHRYHR